MVVEGDYVEVNGMVGYVQYVGSDGYVRVSVDREDGARETVTYRLDEVAENFTNLGGVSTTGTSSSTWIR